jgi:glycine/D-amino acid oxidase-like deaminating enzyme
LTEAARIIVIGAGIVGCGVATYLAQMGWREMLVVNGGPPLGAEDPQITLASPCSGRGFNFASVVGENLANLVADVEAPRGTSKVNLYRFTRRPGRSLRRAVHTETGSTP